MNVNALRILLVEDSPTDLELAIDAMRSGGIANEILVARDGEEAIELLFGKDAPRPRPPLVLLDLNLPKVTGFDVLRRIRADRTYDRTPVVVLTSSRQSPDIERAYSLGATSYIVKPVDFEQFNHAVREIGYYWLVINEPPPEVEDAVSV